MKFQNRCGACLDHPCSACRRSSPKETNGAPAKKYGLLFQARWKMWIDFWTMFCSTMFFQICFSTFNFFKNECSQRFFQRCFFQRCFFQRWMFSTIVFEHRDRSRHQHAVAKWGWAGWAGLARRHLRLIFIKETEMNCAHSIQLFFFYSKCSVNPYIWLWSDRVFTLSM